MKNPYLPPGAYNAPHDSEPEPTQLAFESWEETADWLKTHGFIHNNYRHSFLHKTTDKKAETEFNHQTNMWELYIKG